MDGQTLSVTVGKTHGPSVPAYAMGASKPLNNPLVSVFSIDSAEWKT